MRRNGTPAVSAKTRRWLRAIKELAVRSQYMHINDGLRLEAAIGRALGTTEDAAEGRKAFAEKRKAVFRGR